MFNDIVNRRGSGSYKWDTIVDAGVIERGAYPLSVADMEFRTPVEVREAIKGSGCYDSNQGSVFAKSSI